MWQPIFEVGESWDKLSESKYGRLYTTLAINHRHHHKQQQGITQLSVTKLPHIQALKAQIVYFHFSAG